MSDIKKIVIGLGVFVIIALIVSKIFSFEFYATLANFIVSFIFIVIAYQIIDHFYATKVRKSVFAYIYQIAPLAIMVVMFIKWRPLMYALIPECACFLLLTIIFLILSAKHGR